MPRIQHLLITRFSVRLPVPRTFNQHRVAFDPLDTDKLSFRFRMFEVACLPDVLAQTDQDFTWVLMVDAALSANALARLEALVHQRPRSVIHRYDAADHPTDPGSPLGGINWVVPYLDDPAPDYSLADAWLDYRLGQIWHLLTILASGTTGAEFVGRTGAAIDDLNVAAFAG